MRRIDAEPYIPAYRRCWYNDSSECEDDSEACPRCAEIHESFRRIPPAGLEEYTSPFERAMTPPDDPTPPPPPQEPEPEVKVVRIYDNSAQRQLNDIMRERSNADFHRRRDAHYRDRAAMGYCSTHNIRNCECMR